MESNSWQVTVYSVEIRKDKAGTVQPDTNLVVVWGTSETDQPVVFNTDARIDNASSEKTTYKVPVLDRTEMRTTNSQFPN